ncbi:MAG: hypothetical protein GY719_38140 [bacterium]|nr:hypothetical protein [bacterium]
MSTSARFQRIKQIFLEAAEHQAGARELLVADACGDDTELAGEILGLLALAEEPTGSLQALSHEALCREPEAPATDTQQATGELLAELDGWDRFTELEPIGHGGMGVVFRAWDPRLKRRVALKFLNRLSPRTAERFRREAELQARIDHRHVLDVYETGEVAGQPYLAMKLVERGALMGVRASTTLGQKPADARILLSSLRGVSERAAAAGFALVDFEARVAAGELELRSGDAVAGRRQLESLRDEAGAAGLELFVRRADAILDGGRRSVSGSPDPGSAPRFSRSP